MFDNENIKSETYQHQPTTTPTVFKLFCNLSIDVQGWGKRDLGKECVYNVAKNTVKNIKF